MTSSFATTTVTTGFLASVSAPADTDYESPALGESIDYAVPLEPAH